MKRRSSLRLSILLALALISGGYGCGEGVVIFGGVTNDDDEKETVIVAGNTDDVRDFEDNPITTRDVVVFVYSNLDPADLANGPPFTIFVGTKDVEATILAADETFSLSDIGSGDLAVVFLLDDPEPDGRFDAGDECAVLVDPDGDLQDIQGNRRVDIKDIDVAFQAPCNAGENACPCGDAVVEDGDIVTSTPTEE